MADDNFTCVVCGKTRHLPPSRLKANPRYCCNACYAKDHTGENSPTWKGGLVQKACSHCGAVFYVKPSHAKKGEGVYCSRKCARVARKGKSVPKSRRRITKCCKICGKEIVVKQSHRDTEGTYCSKECMSIGYQSLIGNSNPNWKGGLIEKHCENCGKPMFAIPSMAEKKRFCSRSCTAVWRIKNETPNYGKRSRSGKREDLGGLYVRSSWEANYARYLNWLTSLGEIKSWEYEACEFRFNKIKRGNCFYIPDFKITNNDDSVEYHEVKGWMDKDSRTKLNRMSKYYPEVKIVIIDKDVYRAIALQVRNLIPNWETPSHESTMTGEVLDNFRGGQ